MLEQKMHSFSPERILARGYTLTLCDGRVVASADQLKPGDRVVTRFADGEVESEIVK